MSRFNGEDYEPEYNNAYELWAASVNLHLGGAKGQQVLRELRDALLALPEKKLIAGRLADEQGCVCTVGALAVHRRVAAGEPREKVLADLANLIKPDEKWNEIDDYDAEQQTLTCGQNLGLKVTMAVTLASKNDGDYYVRKAETDEQRYERVLRWVNSRILDGVAA